MAMNFQFDEEVVAAVCQALRNWETHHKNHHDPTDGCVDEGAADAYFHVLDLMEDLMVAKDKEAALARIKSWDIGPHAWQEDDGWVFMTEDQSEILGFAEPEEHPNADAAVASFSRQASEHFGVWFRFRGELHSCADVSTPEDFGWPGDEEEEE